MVLEPIEVMYDRYEFNKLMKSYFDDTTKQIMQGFELVASQLRGKLVAGVAVVPIMERHIRPLFLKTLMIGCTDLGTIRQI